MDAVRIRGCQSTRQSFKARAVTRPKRLALVGFDLGGPRLAILALERVIVESLSCGERPQALLCIGVCQGAGAWGGFFERMEECGMVDRRAELCSARGCPAGVLATYIASRRYVVVTVCQRSVGRVPSAKPLRPKQGWDGVTKFISYRVAWCGAKQGEAGRFFSGASAMPWAFHGGEKTFPPRPPPLSSSASMPSPDLFVENVRCQRCVPQCSQRSRGDSLSGR